MKDKFEITMIVLTIIIIALIILKGVLDIYIVLNT